MKKRIINHPYDAIKNPFVANPDERVKGGSSSFVDSADFLEPTCERATEDWMRDDSKPLSE
jgi:hypothetical protein